MRQLLLFGLILVFLSCNNSPKPTANSTSTGDNQLLNTGSGFKDYVNRDKGFSLSYPAKWDTILKDSNMVFVAVEHDADTLDKFNEGFNVTVFPNEGLTLSQMVDENIKMLKSYYGNSEIVRTSIKNKNGLDSIILQIKQNSEGIALISYSTFFDNGTHLFTVTATIEEAKKQKYSKIMNTVLNSFNWTN